MSLKSSQITITLSAKINHLLPPESREERWKREQANTVLNAMLFDVKRQIEKMLNESIPK